MLEEGTEGENPRKNLSIATSPVLWMSIAGDK